MDSEDVALYTSAKNIARTLVSTSTRLETNPDKKRTGGILTICRNYFQIMNISLVGSVPTKSLVELYSNFSQEKAYRLQADWFRDRKSISSWQTRDVKLKRYGGAVLFQDPCQDFETPFIISFSGLKEPVDEAVSLLLGRKLGLTNETIESKILEISDNKVFKEMARNYSS